MLGTTLEAMWGLLHTLQLLNYLPLINVRVPPNMRGLFQVLGFANLDIKLVKSAFVNYFISKDSLDNTPLP